jgi:hypothetical protein
MLSTMDLRPLSELKDRRDFHEAFQAAMGGAHQNLRELWHFERDQNLPKTYLIEFHPEADSCRNHDRFMRIYLYEGTCGNTLTRIIRSLQHFVDSKLVHPPLEDRYNSPYRDRPPNRPGFEYLWPPPGPPE